MTRRPRSTKASDTAAAVAADSVFEESPNAKGVNGPPPELGRGFDKISEKVFDLGDPGDLYDTIEDALVVKDALTPNVLSDALNDTQDHARNAHRLYVGAKVDFQRFEIDCDVVIGAMRAEATAELQKEKDAGQRSKAITDADVREQAATTHPDEWRDINERKAKGAATVEHLRRLADLWESRSYSLSAMIGAGKRA